MEDPRSLIALGTIETYQSLMFTGGLLLAVFVGPSTWGGVANKPLGRLVALDLAFRPIFEPEEASLVSVIFIYFLFRHLLHSAVPKTSTFSRRAWILGYLTTLCSVKPPRPPCPHTMTRCSS